MLPERQKRFGRYPCFPLGSIEFGRSRPDQSGVGRLRVAVNIPVPVSRVFRVTRTYVRVIVRAFRALATVCCYRCSLLGPCDFWVAQSAC